MEHGTEMIKTVLFNLDTSMACLSGDLNQHSHLWTLSEMRLGEEGIMVAVWLKDPPSSRDPGQVLGKVLAIIPVLRAQEFTGCTAGSCITKLQSMQAPAFSFWTLIPASLACSKENPIFPLSSAGSIISWYSLLIFSLPDESSRITALPKSSCCTFWNSHCQMNKPTCLINLVISWTKLKSHFSPRHNFSVTTQEQMHPCHFPMYFQERCLHTNRILWGLCCEAYQLVSTSPFVSLPPSGPLCW